MGNEQQRVDVNRVLRRAEAQCYQAGAGALAKEVNAARAVVTSLVEALTRANRWIETIPHGEPLRPQCESDMDFIRAALANVGAAK